MAQPRFTVRCRHEASADRHLFTSRVWHQSSSDLVSSNTQTAMFELIIHKNEATSGNKHAVCSGNYLVLSLCGVRRFLSDLTKGWLVKGFHYRITDGPSWIMEQGVHFNDKHNDWQTARGSVGHCPSLIPGLTDAVYAKHHSTFWTSNLFAVYLGGMLNNYVSIQLRSLQKRRPVMRCTGLFFPCASLSSRILCF